MKQHIFKFVTNTVLQTKVIWNNYLLAPLVGAILKYTSQIDVDSFICSIFNGSPTKGVVGYVQFDTPRIGEYLQWENCAICFVVDNMFCGGCLACPLIVIVAVDVGSCIWIALATSPGYPVKWWLLMAESCCIEIWVMLEIDSKNLEFLNIGLSSQCWYLWIMWSCEIWKSYCHWMKWTSG